MLKRSILAVLATTGVLAASAPASATPITVAFTGTIDSGSPLYSGFSVGGTYVYDPALAPRAGSTSTVAYYDETAGFSFSVKDLSNVTVYSGSSTASEIQVGNTGLPDPDRYAVVASALHGIVGGPDPVGFDLGLFFITLLDSTATTISDALTLNLNPLAHTFDSQRFGFNFDPEPGNTDDLIAVGGVVTSLRVVGQDATVPEPGTMILLGTGVAALARRRSRKRA